MKRPERNEGNQEEKSTVFLFRIKTRVYFQISNDGIMPHISRVGSQSDCRKLYYPAMSI